MLSLCRFRTGNSVTAASVWIYDYCDFVFLVVYGAVPPAVRLALQMRLLPNPVTLPRPLAFVREARQRWKLHESMARSTRIGPAQAKRAWMERGKSSASSRRGGGKST
jgi:hypothetical protein